MVAADALHDGAPLLELAQRGGMHPDVLGIGVYLLFEHGEGLALSTPHLPHFLVEQAENGYACQIEVNRNVVHPFAS